MGRSIDVLFGMHVLRPLTSILPKSAAKTHQVIFSDEGVLVIEKGVYPIESLSRACQLSQTKVVHVFPNVQISSSRVSSSPVGATLHCHIQVLGRSISVPARGQSGAMCDLGPEIRGQLSCHTLSSISMS